MMVAKNERSANVLHEMVSAGVVKLNEEGNYELIS